MTKYLTWCTALLAVLFVAPAAAQTCPAGTLGGAVTALERAAVKCQDIPPALAALGLRLDSLSVVERAYLDSALTGFRQGLVQQTDTVTASSGVPTGLWVLAGAAAATGLAALIVALGHHHHVDYTHQPMGTIYIPRPGFCWPPGHCKRQ